MAYDAAMRFGLFYQASEAEGQTHAQRYTEMFDLIALGDTLGFDVAWLAELHFGGAFSLLASPLMMVPLIARRTRRVKSQGRWIIERATHSVASRSVRLRG
jgi:alkanesulfonate monooxygenase SsuD/methylene tetrahydromethanopterin reductase-like flavin-dependent oxidoreductase (luciferase family)